ncbi:hypothetical protein QR680_012271 [Steinernema hermaphroditum]|uniref:U3 small nucleolar RNA-associated protein 25 homolog n=1 Tax=Steinernema hermaphroditum TaxID=289476 RepID=A0AA39M0H5_9BILA|nr:hypothetical protein QR680_012271 [Steinernema hermaphroditum]
MIKSKRKLQPNEELTAKSSKEVVDFFDEHFNRSIDGVTAKQLLAGSYPSSSESFRRAGETFSQTVRYKDQHCVNIQRHLDIEQFNLGEKLVVNAEYANGSTPFGDKEMQLYQAMGRYMDMYVVGDADSMATTVLYVTHAFNHVLKTRQLVIGNKKRLDDLREKTITDEDIESARDQGLARPKVLIMCPFRKYAHRVVQILKKLMFGEGSKSNVDKSARFEQEFGDNGFRIHENRKVSDEFRELMKGNVDDCFRVGISVAKKALKLFTPFEESDIILCSPIGLRMIIGEESEKHHEHDFLASIELAIVDHADIFLMQNWEHITTLFESLHKKPESLNVDISRVRQWSLDQHAKLFRQTLLFANVDTAEFRALFAQHCQNYAGLVTVTPPPQNGYLSEIEIPICQEIHRFRVAESQTQSDARFNYFVSHILPKCDMGTMIFVSSYFDYVRLRNYLKREGESFVQLHEYATDKKISRARGMFFGQEKKIIMMTERFHYFRRYVIRGVKSYAFYQLPLNPSFYHEIVNSSNAQGDKTVTRIIFNKFDAIRLRNTFGAEHAKALLNAQQDFHVLMSE